MKTTVDNLTASERETTILFTDDSEKVLIDSTQKGQIGKMRRHAKFTEIDSGFYGTTEWARFEILASEWNVATGAKRNSNQTPEQKQRAAERLRAARQGGGNGN